MLTIWKRIAALFGGNRLERELNEELETHLAMQEEEFRARGMSPRAARMAARREFGGVAQTAEAYRERRGIPWIEGGVKDLRYAFRGLARNRGFTAAPGGFFCGRVGGATPPLPIGHHLPMTPKR